MKINLLSLLLFIAVAQASAQTITPEPKTDPHDIRLYQVTVRTMAGEKIEGIFYAMTDSTLVFFANNRVAVKQFRAGQLPELYALSMADVKRISVQRKGHFLRQTAIGAGFGVVFLGLGTLLIASKAGIAPVSIGYLLGYLLAPAMVLGGMGQGLIPQRTESTLGKTRHIQIDFNRLDKYTIVSQ